MIQRRKQPKSTAATAMNVLWKVVALGYLMFWTVYWLNVPTEAAFSDETDTDVTLKAAEHFDSVADEEDEVSDSDDSDKQSKDEKEPDRDKPKIGDDTKDKKENKSVSDTAEQHGALNDNADVKADDKQDKGNQASEENKEQLEKKRVNQKKDDNGKQKESYADDKKQKDSGNKQQMDEK